MQLHHNKSVASFATRESLLDLKKNPLLYEFLMGINVFIQVANSMRGLRID